MERQILMICNNKTIFRRLQYEWSKDGIIAYETSDFSNVVKELSTNDKFVLIIIFENTSDELTFLRILRKITKVPILVLKQQYNSAKKVAVIEAGADECIAWSDEYLAEVVASGRALIRRYTELNQTAIQPMNIILRGNLFMSMDYRTAFLNARELTLPRREFELLYFLASNPGRVFTNEQLYQEVWGEEYFREADNGLHSCINRIRRKLEEIPNSSCYIENMRGVGYRFIQNDI